MLAVVRYVISRVHHAPWVCAAIILAAGVANWAWFSPKQAPPPDAEKEAAVFLDQDAFRQMVTPPSANNAPVHWTEEPFSLDPSPSTSSTPFPPANGD